MSKAKIELYLKASFKPAYLEVVDESHRHAGHAGALQGGHFRVHIQAAAFDGKNLLESHRMVYQALQPVQSSIHALSINIRRP